MAQSGLPAVLFRELPQGDLDRLACIAYVQANAQKHRDTRGRFVAGLLAPPPPENALIGNVLMEVHAPRKDGKRRKLGESLIRVLKVVFFLQRAQVLSKWCSGNVVRKQLWRQDYVRREHAR